MANPHPALLLLLLMAMALPIAIAGSRSFLAGYAFPKRERRREGEKERERWPSCGCRRRDRYTSPTATASRPTTHNCTLLWVTQVRPRVCRPLAHGRASITVCLCVCVCLWMDGRQPTDHFAWQPNATAQVPATYQQRVYTYDGYFKGGRVIL